MHGLYATGIGEYCKSLPSLWPTVNTYQHTSALNCPHPCISLNNYISSLKSKITTCVCLPSLRTKALINSADTHWIPVSQALPSPPGVNHCYHVIYCYLFMLCYYVIMFIKAMHFGVLLLHIDVFLNNILYFVTVMYCLLEILYKWHHRVCILLHSAFFHSMLCMSHPC